MTTDEQFDFSEWIMQLETLIGEALQAKELNDVMVSPDAVQRLNAAEANLAILQTQVMNAFLAKCGPMPKWETTTLSLTTIHRRGDYGNELRS